jgi:hypothetical protein
MFWRRSRYQGPSCRRPTAPAFEDRPRGPAVGSLMGHSVTEDRWAYNNLEQASHTISRVRSR